MANNLAGALQDDMPLFDAALVQVYLDDKLMQRYNGDDLVDVAWTNEQVTWTVDAQGSSSAVRKHDGRGTITFHLNRASAMWKDIIAMGSSTTYHKIDIMTPYEHVYSNNALLSKNPDIKVGGGDQTVDAAFSAGSIVLEQTTQSNEAQA